MSGVYQCLCTQSFSELITCIVIRLLADVCLENQAVEPDKSLDEIRQEEYSLPSGFEWDTLNIDDAKQVGY